MNYEKEIAELVELIMDKDSPLKKLKNLNELNGGYDV